MEELPSQDILVPDNPSLRRPLDLRSPSFSICMPSFVIGLCPRFKVSRCSADVFNREKKP